MAFNPFHRFRKHQKVIFAGLTIICMLVFIGQFGSFRGGDIFATALAWMGAGRGQGQLVTTLYGSKVTEGDLEKVLQRRRVADLFMQVTVGLNVEAAVRDVQARVDKMPTDRVPGAVSLALADWKQRQTGQLPVADPYQQAVGDLMQLQQTLQTPGMAKEPEQRQLVEALIPALQFDAWRWDPRRATSAMYFGGSRKPEDLLDFLVWKHQAERLGITLTEADMRNEVNREAGNRPVLQGKSFTDEPWVLQFLQRQEVRNAGLTPQGLQEALTDEFRVALAQEALLGVASGARAYRADGGIDQSPAAPTPDQFLDYYLQQRTSLKVALLPIPVNDPKFMATLRSQGVAPTESQLRRSFDKYREQEPAPERREPGFKQPRRIKIEYVSASAQDPYYTEQGRKLAQSLALFSDPGPAATIRFSAGASLSAPGSGLLGGVVGRLFPLAFDPYRNEYEAYLTGEPYWGDSGAGRLHDTSLARPENGAALFGQVLGSSLSRGSILSPLGAYVGSAAGAEVRTSVRFNAGLLLAEASRSPLTAVALAAPRLPPVPTLQQVRTRLTDKVGNDLAVWLLHRNLEALKDELAKKKGDPRGAEQVVAEAVKQYHLQFHTMKRPRSAHTITRDPSIKELTRALGTNLATMGNFLRSMNRPLPTLEDVLFASTRDEFFRQLQLVGPPGVYMAQELPAEKQALLWWRSDEFPARVQKFEDAGVRREVQEAWFQEKARKPALDEATRISKELTDRNWPTDSDARQAEILSVLNSHARQEDKAFVLSNVSQLVAPAHEVQEGQRREYRPYQLPADIQDQFPYPPPDLVKQLLTLKKPGQAMVLRDQGVHTYYVAVLLDRDPPSGPLSPAKLEEFNKLYAAAADHRDPLWERAHEQQRFDFTRRVLADLRREAGPVDDDGQFIIPEGIRLRGSETRDYGD